MELNERATDERDRLLSEYEMQEEDIETTLQSYREVLEHIEKSSGDSNLKKEMLKHVKENDDSLKTKSGIVEKNKNQKKKIKEIEDELKEHEKIAEQLKG